MQTYNKIILATLVWRFLYLVGGPSLSYETGGCTREKRTSSGMKSLCSEVGRGLDLSMSFSLLLSSGNTVKGKNNLVI